MTSKGVLQQNPLTMTKNTQVAVNSKCDQKPIAKRTRSRIDSTSPPNIQISQTLNKPIAVRTRSSTLSQKYTTPSHSRVVTTQLLTDVANSVLDHDTGKKCIMDNLGSIQSFKKHGTNISQMKWED